MAKGYFNGYAPFTAVSVMDSLTEEEVRDFISKYIGDGMTAVSVINPMK